MDPRIDWTVEGANRYYNQIIWGQCSPEAIPDNERYMVWKMLVGYVDCVNEYDYLSVRHPTMVAFAVGFLKGWLTAKEIPCE